MATGGSVDAPDAGFQASQLMLMMLAFRESSGHRRVG